MYSYFRVRQTVGTANWTESFSGDGGYSAWNDDGTNRYVSVQEGMIFRLAYSDANDLTANSVATEITPSGYNTSLFIVPFYLDPVNDNLFYLGGGNDLFINTQASNSSSSTGWKSIILPGNINEISELGVSSQGIVYAGTSDGKIFKVQDPGGTTPVVTELTANFPSGPMEVYTPGYISGIGVNPFRANEVLVSLSNYSILSIFYTNDSGTTWTNVGGNLEEENVNGTGNGPSVRVARIHGDGDRYFVGTSTGLYSTTAMNGATTTWLPEDGSGIGNVVVEHMVTRVSDGLVVAGTHGNGVYSAVFELSPGLDNDLGINAITAPVTSLLTSTEAVTTTVFNFGQNEQTAYDLSLFVDNVLIVTDNVTTPIATNSALNHTFSTTVDLSTSISPVLKVQVALAGDENSFNDEFEKTIQNVFRITTFPYFEGFEDDDHEWESVAPWELGAPANTVISSASEGARAWVTDLDGDYTNSANATLMSPVLDFSNMMEPIVGFDINFLFETDIDGTNYDGAVLGYRTDLSALFTTVPNSWGEMNWYNNLDVEVFSNTPAWSNTSNGYIGAQAQLLELVGEEIVQLAFIFKSDVDITREGMAVDNFLIRDESIANNNPTFTAGPDISIDRNSGLQSFTGWATSISDGDNASQKLSFTLTNDNSSLFSVQPTVSNVGDLTFTPAENTFGLANVTVTLMDDGWTPNDLTDDLSASANFVITELLTAIDIPAEQKIDIYPNPTDNVVNIDFEGSIDQRKIELHSLSGVLLREMYSGSESITIDLSAYPKGIYLLSTQSGTTYMVSRIIKN